MKCFFLFALLFCSFQIASASQFHIDATQLENKFQKATEIKLSENNFSNLVMLPQFHSDRKRITASLLAFVVGAFGVHRFYLGHNSAGWAHVIASFSIIGFSPSILIGYIDAIMYITSTDEEFESKYVSNKKIIQWL